MRTSNPCRWTTRSLCWTRPSAPRRAPWRRASGRRGAPWTCSSKPARRWGGRGPAVGGGSGASPAPRVCGGRRGGPFRSATPCGAGFARRACLPCVDTGAQLNTRTHAHTHTLWTGPANKPRTNRSTDQGGHQGRRARRRGAAAARRRRRVGAGGGGGAGPRCLRAERGGGGRARGGGRGGGGELSAPALVTSTFCFGTVSILGKRRQGPWVAPLEMIWATGAARRSGDRRGCSLQTGAEAPRLRPRAPRQSFSCS
jgi:hypothetical protein